MTKYEPVFFDIETTGLNPMARHFWSGTPAARVGAVGFGVLKGWREATEWEDVDCQVEVLWNEDEYPLLRDLNSVMENLCEQVGGDGGDGEAFFVGFNSRNFDHPYLGARFARKRLEGCVLNHGGKRLDMMRVAGQHPDTDRYPSQDDTAQALGIDVADEYDGEDMPGLIEDGDFEAVASHARADVAELCRIFFGMKESAMDEFYDHYDIEQSGNYVEEVDF